MDPTISAKQLTVSDNHRYILENGKPFFWFADTAWLMFLRMSEEEIDIYLRNRKEKGINVIQAVLIHSFAPDSKTSLLPAAGNTAGEDYWSFVERVLDKMDAIGLYAGLLPIWGQNIKDGRMGLANMTAYAEFLGARFRDRRNIIWILGGDVRGDAGIDIFRREAEILKKHNPERLITFHPFGRTSSSYWFQDSWWLDFNMFQSGHRRYDQAQLGEWDDRIPEEPFYGEDNWRYVLHDHGCTPIKPTLDGEPSYEGIPQGLHNVRNPYWEEWDVRRYAYWSVFAGAAGHTYGSNAVMQVWNNPDELPAYGARELWSEAIHHPGIGQLSHLKSLMESVDFIHGSPRDDLLAYGQKERYHRIAVLAGDDYIFCYDYMGDDFMLRMDGYKNRKLDCWWMDPRSGVKSYIKTVYNEEKLLFSPPARKEFANDWVLIVKAAN